MCGILFRFKWFESGTLMLSQEDDWNVFIIPQAPYDPLFQATRLLSTIPGWAGHNEHWKCDTQTGTVIEALTADQSTCFEGEVTPHFRLYQHPLFDRSRILGGGDSPLRGDTVCLYGPWVTEALHGHRPEIHPIESMWWKSGDTTAVLTLLDNSNRFSRKSHYASIARGPGMPKRPIEPWTPDTLTRRIRYPFVVSTSNPQTYSVVVDNDYHHNAVLFGNSLETELKGADGRPLLSVYEGNGEDHTKIDFDVRSECPDGSATIVTGDIVIETQVTGAEGDRGFMLVYIVPRKLTAPPLSAPLVNVDEVGTLRNPGMGLFNGIGPSPVGDYRISLAGPTRSAVTISRYRRKRTEDWSFAANEPVRKGDLWTNSFEVRAIPVAEPAAIEVEHGSGIIEIKLPSVRLAPVINVMNTGETDAAPAVDVFVKRVEGGMSIRKELLAPLLRRYKRVRLRVEPRFAASSGGEADAARHSIFAHRLNQAAAKNDVNALFSTTAIFESKWDEPVMFDLRSNARVPLVRGRTATSSHGAWLEARAGDNVDLDVTFPTDPDGVYWVTSKASLSGVISQVASTVAVGWSHTLKGDKDELAKAVYDAALALSGKRSSEIQEANQRVPHQDPAARNLSRLAGVLSAVSATLADDGAINICELSIITATARKLSEANDRTTLMRNCERDVRAGRPISN